MEMAILTAVWLVAVLAGTVRNEWVKDWRQLRRSAILLPVAVVSLATVLICTTRKDLEVFGLICGGVHVVGLALLLLAYWPKPPEAENPADDNQEERSE